MSSLTKYEFYGHTQKYGWMFSNYSPLPVLAYGILWPTSEHLFQAMKFKGTDDEYYKKIATVSLPETAMRMGHSRNHPLRDDWEEVKDDVMYFVVRTKVLQHNIVRDELEDTGDREIVYGSLTDYYWGCGADRTGRNQLGKTFMQVRKDLRLCENEPGIL